MYYEQCLKTATWHLNNMHCALHSDRFLAIFYWPFFDPSGVRCKIHKHCGVSARSALLQVKKKVKHRLLRFWDWWKKYFSHYSVFIQVHSVEVFPHHSIWIWMLDVVILEWHQMGRRQDISVTTRNFRFPDHNRWNYWQNIR